MGEGKQRGLKMVGCGKSFKGRVTVYLGMRDDGKHDRY